MIDYKMHIHADPAIMLGKPVIKGARITVELVLRKLSEGYVIQELLEMYPSLTADDVLAALAYAAAVLESEEVIPAA